MALCGPRAARTTRWANEDVQALTKRLTPSLAGYLVMIVLGLYQPIVAVLGYLAVAFYLIVPFGLIRHRVPSR